MDPVYIAEVAPPHARRPGTWIAIRRYSPGIHPTLGRHGVAALALSLPSVLFFDRDARNCAERKHVPLLD